MLIRKTIRYFLTTLKEVSLNSALIVHFGSKELQDAIICVVVVVKISVTNVGVFTATVNVIDLQEKSGEEYKNNDGCKDKMLNVKSQQRRG